jgi:hypothetical protein
MIIPHPLRLWRWALLVTWLWGLAACAGSLPALTPAPAPSVLVAGLSSPQGLALDADGNLVVTDPGHHRLIKIVIRRS